MATIALFTDDLTLPDSLQEAVEHGEVFTRAWVVELVLDLLGYTADKDLCDLKLVEPACGGGAFLTVVASRISASCHAYQRPISDAIDAVRAFDMLGCKVVGLRTDNFNLASQRAIEALGAKKDGVIRHARARRDGTVRDSVIYSIVRPEWPGVRERLKDRLDAG